MKMLLTLILAAVLQAVPDLAFDSAQSVLTLPDGVYLGAVAGVHAVWQRQDALRRVEREVRNCLKDGREDESQQHLHLSTSFCTRHDSISPTMISLGLRQSIMWTTWKPPNSLLAWPNLPTIVPSSSIL